MGTKTCTICRKDQPVAEFRFDNVAMGIRKTRCRECENARMRADRLKYGEARRATDRRRYRNRPEAQHRKTIMRRYDLTEAQADAVVKETNCDLCGRDNGTKRMVVDHCHTTGQPRGVLCDRCNLALGHLDDDITLIERAIAYIKAGGSGRFA